MIYAFSENFVLPLSHDEVVYGKGSLINKMPGDYWQKFANVRLLLGYMHAQPGKKLLFMGSELGQWDEWQHESELDWSLLDFESHRQLQHWVTDLNIAHRKEPILHEMDYQSNSFEWIDANDSDNSTISFLRKGQEKDEIILIVCNFTPVSHYNYRIGVPKGGFWREILNSDAQEYGGSGVGNFGGLHAERISFHGRRFSLELTLPPLAILFFKYRESGE
jgi:1,4-alpha-glucan branching enzyme